MAARYVESEKNPNVWLLTNINHYHKRDNRNSIKQYYWILRTATCLFSDEYTLCDDRQLWFLSVLYCHASAIIIAC